MHERKQANWRERLRLWGWRRSLYWLLMSALARLGLRLHRVDTAPYRNRTPAAQLPDGYRTGYVPLAELQAMLPVDGLNSAFLKQAEAHGDICVANFYLDQLVGYSFYARARARVTDQLDILVPRGFEYVYKSWTHPEHRRRHLNKARANLHQPAALTPVWYVETHNYASLLTHYRYPAGRPLRAGYLGWFSVLGRHLPFTSRQAKRLGLRLVRNAHDGRLWHTEL
ncbi:MAG: hypothetical protein AAF993_03230 [Pseudomonadota bacterium]